ncbi:phosphoglucosamine mutase [Candidatus Omnitrophus magneticus]|uniref:Phosphoglucosamine mutase n=1 Tax=Candidatus Omnitrophus magneticus TaxID=1609969 RepID=A0A0F0CX88_9BACT|nr:phosphoglucosamine mutase [Candidatus Omnitrophus magneticus]
MSKLFGTDGIRGVTNKEPMTSEIALKVGQAVGYLARERRKRPRIIIGKDTRLSGYMLENAITSGVASMGGDVILVGPMPTPGIAFIVDNMDADCGIVISASHNPFEDNGIKIFFGGDGKLTDEQEEKLESLIFSGKLFSFLAEPSMIGKVWKEQDALGRYIVFLKHTFPRHMDLDGMKIVIDCANGATYKVAPLLFREMRADVIPLNVAPNGENINQYCGALYPQELAKKVLETKAHIGIAFDGDGDRFIAVDEKGNIITGDQILAICAENMKKAGTLKNNLVVSTIMSNIGLKHAFDSMGISNIQAKVGDRYVREEMLKNGACLGGEDSGHIIFLDHHSTGDGILSALQILSVMKKEEKSLSELSKIMRVFPQVLINVEVNAKPDIKDIPELSSIISQAEKELSEEGRVLVRYSGTQNICRVMVEGPTQSKTQDLAEMISNSVVKILGNGSGRLGRDH